MRRTTYKDPAGRIWEVMLPNGMPDSDAEMGMIVGPVDTRGLGLPDDFQVRLHNELYARKLFSSKDARARRQDLTLAVVAAGRGIAERIYQLMMEEEGGANTEQLDNGNNGGGKDGRRKKVNG